MPSYSQRLNSDSIGFDSYIDEGNPLTNYGGNTTLFSGFFSSGKDDEFHYRTYFKYDLSQYAGLITVSNAVMTFFGASSHSGNISYSLLRVTGSWTEFGLTASNEPAVTFTGASTAAANPYTGGPYDVVFNDAALDALIQDAVDNRNGLFDMRLDNIAPSIDSIMQFYSSEDGTDTRRPLLTFDFEWTPRVSSALAFAQAVDIAGSTYNKVPSDVLALNSIVDHQVSSDGGSELRPWDFDRRIKAPQGYNIWIPPRFRR